MSYPSCTILLPAISVICLAFSSCSSQVERTVERGVPIPVPDVSIGVTDEKVAVPDISAFRITDQFAIDTTLLVNKPYEAYKEPMYDYDSMAVPIHWHPPGVPGIIQSKLRGDIYIRVYVDSTGNVPYAYIFKSTEVLLNKPALEAIVRWKFAPAVLNGKRVPCWITIPFRSRPE
jgi:TonB family protein